MSIRICIFTGSSRGRNETYIREAKAFGTLLGERGIGLVYGGASIGLMGAVADAACAAGSSVIGVIPKSIVDLEFAHHQGLDDLRIVGSMHERKATMAELSDAFVAMPGGIGTLEEIFEVWTWAQLGQHTKPVCFLNVDGFFNPLMEFIDHVIDAQFLKLVHREMIIVEEDPMTLLAAIDAYQPPDTKKWLDIAST